MERKIRHIKVFDDVMGLYKAYLPCYQNFPKGFRYATGSEVFNELTDCLKHITLINRLVKNNSPRALEYFNETLSSLAVIQAYLILAWELKYLSHAKASELSTRIEEIQKQLQGWLRWFTSQHRHPSKA